MLRIEMVKLRVGWVAVVVSDFGELSNARWWFTAEGAQDRCVQATIAAVADQLGGA